MKEHTIKELADIGSAAVATYENYWELHRPAREAFAKAVRDAVLDAVLADLVAKSDALPDPFAELKAAHAAGKVIQIKALSKNGALHWEDVPQPLFNCSVILYRIKPEPVLVPLDIDDIRATDEFRSDYDSGFMRTVSNWNSHGVRLPCTGNVSYADLAANYLRRQHGSNEWKPCTKEAKI
jgi:hypothetical protein